MRESHGDTTESSAAVREAQRIRLITGAATAARSLGVAEVTVSDIVVRSGVSRRTFYQLFGGRQDCLQAAFEEAVRRAGVSVLPAYEAQGSWAVQMRSGLAALLELLDRQPILGAFGIVDSLGAGEQVLQRRAQVISALVDAVDRGREKARSEALTRMTAEGLVAAVLGILHARLLERERSPLRALLPELMSIIVRPYLGASAALAELRRGQSPAPSPRPARAQADPSDILRSGEVRWTYRTMRALVAIAENPGSSNRQVGQAAGIVDQGQISKLLTRLQRVGLVENHGGPLGDGQPNAWRLTAKGADAQRSIEMALR
jgi:AcrR family transcriptional regulator/DNA-binding MarR family transcriptional regulator